MSLTVYDLLINTSHVACHMRHLAVTESLSLIGDVSDCLRPAHQYLYIRVACHMRHLAVIESLS